jgi:hypothetical protein
MDNNNDDNGTTKFANIMIAFAVDFVLFVGLFFAWLGIYRKKRKFFIA